MAANFLFFEISSFSSMEKTKNSSKTSKDYGDMCQIEKKIR